VTSARGKDPASRGTERVGEAAHGLLKRLDKGGNIERARAVAAWRDVAGEEVAAHAMGFAMRGSELLVYVDSPVWATELTALSERYRSDINTAVGKELVGSMRFTVSKKVSEEHAWEEARRMVAESAQVRHIKPIPATAQERSQIEAMAAGIHDETLREAAVSAAICGLEWRKGREADKSSENAIQRVDNHENRV
jgi:hypothetical protein